MTLTFLLIFFFQLNMRDGLEPGDISLCWSNRHTSLDFENRNAIMKLRNRNLKVCTKVTFIHLCDCWFNLFCKKDHILRLYSSQLTFTRSKSTIGTLWWKGQCLPVLCNICIRIQSRIENPVKHLRWSVLI